MQSIGERLEEARKRKGITVREAAEATKIRGDYINSFESNTFKINIPDIYTRGFLRSYASYLKLNVDKIITDYNAHLLGEGKSPRRDSREFFGRLELQQTPPTDEPNGANAPSDHDFKIATDATESVSIWEKLNLEKDVAIKIAIAGTLALAVIITLVWGILAFMGSEEPSADTSLPATPATISPAANATTFTLIANDDVRVGIRQINGDIPIFEAPLPQGVEKELAATGSIRVTYSDAAALSIRIGTETYDMVQGKTSIRITPSDIFKNQAGTN